MTERSKALRVDAGPLAGAAESDASSASWSAALSYLPPVLLDATVLEPDRPPVWIEDVEGTLVFADISGFTRMSERLAESGKEGAETLTNIINRYFHRMLDIAAEHGGTNVKFGGDALLLLFSGENHAARAVSAALQIQRATKEFPAVKVPGERVRLHMSVGVHSGTFWSVSVGVSNLRMQYIILGTEASRVAETEGEATAGEVLVTEETRLLIKGARLGEPRNGAYRVLRLVRPPEVPSEIHLSRTLPPQDDRLLAYLPPPVVDRLSAADGMLELEGEHRNVSIMFIHLIGINELLEEQGPTVLVEELQRYISTLVKLANKYGGFVAGNDISELGIKLILVFGAPVANERDPENALRLGLEMREELPIMGLHLTHRIGVNSGSVFVGDVGSPYRREYTVIGDAVNLSARLMGAAESGQVLLSRKIAEEAGPGFVLDELEPVRVKGKREPVPICSLKSVETRPVARAGVIEGKLYGRETELETLRQAGTEVEAGNGRLVLLTGEAGIGKSRLVSEFESQLSYIGWDVYRGQCRPHTAGNPFSLWVHLLESFFGIESIAETRLRTRTVLDKIGRLRPALLGVAPLLNGLLSLSASDTDVVQSLDAETRRHRLFDLISTVLREAASNRRIAVVLEDLQWSDQSSLRLIESVVQGLDRSRLLVCLTCRTVEDLELKLPADGTVTLDLGKLSDDASAEIVWSMLGVDALPAQVTDSIISKAQGNPLFLEEIARTIRLSGALDQVLKASAFALDKAIASLDIPDRIQALVMSRIDRLAPSSRDVLRTAAVIGGTFDLSTLMALLDLNDRRQLESRLDELTEYDLINVQEGALPDTFGFIHGMVQEVAYENLLFSRRRKLHRRVAEHVEDYHHTRLEPFFETLEYHYRLSGDHPKTAVYAVRAADKARQVFAHDEAIEYYRRGLAALDKFDGQLLRQRCALNENIGDCFQVSGRPDQAAQSFARALRIWRKSVRSAPHVETVLLDTENEPPPRAREALLCQKIGVSHERNSDYDLSLKWLETAWQRLPARHPVQAAAICAARSVALYRKGLYQDALHWGRRGLTLSRRTGEPRQLAHTHNMLATSYVELGKHRAAIRHRTAAIRLYEQVGDPPGLLSAHNNLGASYQLLGELDQAIEHYEAAVENGEKVGNPIAVAVVHNNIAEVLLVQDRLDEAAIHLQGVVDTYETEGDPLAATGLALVNLSRIFLRKNDHPAALQRLDYGVKLLRTAGARPLLVEAALQRAELELAMEGPASAEKICLRALRQARQIGAGLFEARGLRILGRILTEQGAIQEAETHLRDSIAVAGRVLADHERGLALLQLAELYSSSVDGTKSRRGRSNALRQAVSIFRRIGAWAELSYAERLQSNSTE